MNNTSPLILIVDDYLQNVQVLGRILESNQYNIAIAHDGTSALKLTTQILPDLILLDVTMPDISGYEVCKKLKESNHTKNIPIIFLTARTEPEDIEKAFSCGGNDFLHKPFNMHELLTKIQTQLDLANLKTELTKMQFQSNSWKYLFLQSHQRFFKHLQQADLQPSLAYTH